MVTCNSVTKRDERMFEIKFDNFGRGPKDFMHTFYVVKSDGTVFDSKLSNTGIVANLPMSADDIAQMLRDRY